MLAICCLCATLSKEDMLTSITDKGHNVNQQLKHCFKFEIENLQRHQKYVCNDCIKTLQACDDFFRKIQRAQETLRILYKAKSQSNAEKSAKKVAGTIRVRDFCKMKDWEDDNKSEDSTAQTLKATTTTSVNKNTVRPIEEYNCSNSNNVDIPEIKVESEDTTDPLETTTNDFGKKSTEETAENPMVFENFLYNVIARNTDDTAENDNEHFDEDEIENASKNPNENPVENANIVVDENVEESAEQSTSEEAFSGFDQIIDVDDLIEELPEQESLDENATSQIQIRNVKFQCESCSKHFLTEELLQKHLRHHTDRVYKCSYCPKAFHHPSSLYYHIRTHKDANSEEKEYKCGYCAKSYSRYDGLKVHLRTHSKENSFQCTKCPKAFRHSSSLWYHMKAHANDRQYKCYICSKAYFRRESLENHIAVHQKSKNAASLATKSVYTCDICEKNFHNQQLLSEHMVEHKQEGTYRCKKCTNTFISITGLRNHLRWHRERQYTCEYCYKDFRSLIWYKTHLRTHSVSAREHFKCGSCSGTFLSQRSLTAHTCVQDNE